MIFAVNAALAASQPEAVALLEEVDRMYRTDSSEAEMVMKVVTPDWSREIRLRAWSQGMKKTFIRILEPKKDEGIATLRLDREMWNYFPKINKVVKVPPSMMMGSWMGSDFTNDDLVHETSLVEEYDVTMVSEAKTHVLTVIPKANTATVWGKILITIDRASGLPVEQLYFDEKGKQVRVMHFKDVREFGGRKLPAVMELVPLGKEGHRTTVTYVRAAFNKPVDSAVFSLRNLQKR
ncbi:MAG: outer membrane lipoprotein-sorting protein [Oligoflexia bacterium]|nr:outer membrane lipoprotein-sorting protein [Oligoflexia bacterium]